MPAFIIGFTCAVLLILVAIWSICYPQRSLWPPANRSRVIEVGIWPATAAVFWGAASVGLADWNGLDWPAWLRWGIGLPVLLAANVVVSTGMWQLGLGNTSGIPDGLVTTGLYRHSRNPQYLANMAALIGWFILSASAWTLPVILPGIIMFLIATEAEDRWMAIKYGEAFEDWKAKTPRLFLT